MRTGEYECTPSVIRDTRQPSICHVRSMSARTIMVSSGRSLRAVIGGAASLVISNPDHTKKGLSPTTAELIRVKRHKFPDAHRRPAGHPLHAVRQPVIPTRPVQLGHRQQMQGQVLRQSRLLQLPFPILGGNVSVCDLTVQRVRVLPGDSVHVLRPRTGEFVEPAQVRPRVGEDSSDYPSDIRRGNRRGLAPPEGHFDAASVADGRTGEREKALQEHSRPDGDDRQAGPRERLLAEPVLPLLTARGGLLDAHLGDGHLGHVDEGVHPDFPGDRRHSHGRFQVPGGHGHAEVDSPTAAGAEVVVGDLLEPADVYRVVSGCRRVYFGMSVSAGYLEATVTMAAVAREVGVDALVNMSQMTVSQMSIQKTTPSRQQRQHWLSEQALAWSGLPVVTIRPTMFLESFFPLAGPTVRDRGRF